MSIDLRILRCTGGLLVGLCLASGCDAQQTSQEFHEGRSQLMRGELQKADVTLSRFATSHPTHKLASRAAFLQGKAQLGLGNYGKAQQCFETTIKRYPKSDEAHKSRYKLAMLELFRGNRDAALQKFQALVDKPSGTLVPESQAMVRMLSAPLPAAP